MPARGATIGSPSELSSRLGGEDDASTAMWWMAALTWIALTWLLRGSDVALKALT